MWIFIEEIMYLAETARIALTINKFQIIFLL